MQLSYPILSDLTHACAQPRALNLLASTRSRIPTTSTLKPSHCLIACSRLPLSPHTSHYPPMKSFIATLLAFVCLFGGASAFTSPGARVATRSALAPKVQSSTSTSLNMVFGNKKSAAQKAEEEAKAAKYWQGEWVCKDCGYIYNRAECAGMYFEEQGPGFRCPQCSGPRRRYAKKVGDVVGTTLDGGDAPILIFSFGGVIATIIFGFWAVNNL